MPDRGDLLEQLREHLVAQGLVRKPSVAGGGPPLWLDPSGGAPGPGDKKGTEADGGLVLSAFGGGGLAAAPFESFWRRDTVDVWLRATHAQPLVYGAEAALRAELVGDLGRRDWDMGALRVIESLEWRALQRVPGVVGPGHSYVVSYMFQYLA